MADKDKQTQTAALIPWPLMDNRVQRKTLYKTSEELSEAITEMALLQKAIMRCLMQGMDAHDPASGVHNTDALQKEIADVQANCKLLIENLELDKEYIRNRKNSKYLFLRDIHART